MANRVICSKLKSISAKRDEVKIFNFERRTLTALNTAEERSGEKGDKS